MSLVYGAKSKARRYSWAVATAGTPPVSPKMVSTFVVGSDCKFPAMEVSVELFYTIDQC